LDAINNGAPKGAERLQDPFAVGHVAAIAGDHSYERRPVRTIQESDVGSEFVRRTLHVVTEVADDVNGHITRVEEKAAQYCVNRVGLELERSDNAEVPTSAAESPEEILVFSGIRREHSTVRGD
jgi:hypothetical protein